MKLIILLVAGILVLAGCGNDPGSPSSDPEGKFSVVKVNVDGSMVNCVTWEHGYGGGISCDWNEATLQDGILYLDNMETK